MVKFNMPQGLSEETQKFMKDVVKELNARKAISNIDLGALRMLATSYEMYLQSSSLLLAQGPVVIVKGDQAMNPAQNAATKSYSQVMKIMTEYGLTIKSRGNIKAMADEKEDNSPLDAFIAQSTKTKKKEVR